MTHNITHTIRDSEWNSPKYKSFACCSSFTSCCTDGGGALLLLDRSTRWTNRFICKAIIIVYVNTSQQGVKFKPAEFTLSNNKTVNIHTVSIRVNY